jgi:signal transduction histidine kinase/DNA-binding response OmpR family regulator
MSVHPDEGAFDFRRIFQSSPDLYLLLSPSLVIIDASSAYLAATLTRREAIVGKSLFAVFPDNPDDPAADGVRNLRASLNRVQATGQPDVMALQKYDVPRPDGRGFEVKYWSPCNFPIRDGEGRIEAILHRVEDVTERAARAKSSFLANMSHEIRTPMNAVIGMTSILSDTNLTDDQRDAVDVIRSSSDHLLSVINDILDYSKIEAGKVELDRTPFSLRDCLESAIDLLAATACKKGVELGYLMHPGVPEGLLGDPGRLRQILANLLSNAVKFTPARGQVSLDVTSRPIGEGQLEVEIAVKDTGIGILPEVQGRLFQPFEQADASTTRVHGGTGLGLSISRRLVELMGGRIWVASRPGQGSEFTFTLLTSPAALKQTLAPFYQLPALTGLRVLIVDDLEINRRILSHYAGLWGMSATETESSEEALRWIQRGDTFDLALLDYHMPALDGLELARLIRAQPQTHALPIIILSSVALEAEAKAVVNGTMVKPIKPTRLLDAISVVLRREAAPRAAPDPFRFSSESAAKHPLRILIAEDNSVNKKVAQLLFAKLGCRPDFVSDGLEALESVERQIYDVLFMDVRMPVMDGLQATREICRRHPSDRRPRIVALSANALEEDRKEALLSGMDDYLAKPVTAEILVAALLRCKRRPVDDGYSATVMDEQPMAELAANIGQDGIKQVYAMYLTDAEKLLARVQEGVRSGQRAIVIDAVHQLKATSGSVGATQVFKKSAEFELLVRNAPPSEWEGMRQAVESSFRRVEIELKRRL